MSSAIKSPVPPGLAQKRALLAERLRKAASEPRQSPLSFAQQRLWFLDQLEPNSALYNIGAVARIDGALDVSALQQALDAVVTRHETLRTRFTCPDEIPTQVIDPHRGFKLKVVALSGHSEQAKAAEAQQLIRAELNRPFRLSEDHPLRATLLRLRPDEHRLILILHHIVADEWSLGVLFKEVAALYAGQVQAQPVSLPELPIQYADYARWQRSWLQGSVLDKQLEYWKKQLGACPPATELPTDHPRGPTPTFNGRNVTRSLGKALSQELKDLANSREATLFMVLLAAFKALIYRYTQQEDLIVGSPVAGRNRIETESLIGFFVNTLALRTSLAGNPSFGQLLARVREATLGALGHQDVPFDRVVEELQPERTLAHLPFTRLMFALQSGIAEEIALPGARLCLLEVESELAKFDLTLVLSETSQGLLAKVEYNRDLFQPDTISRLLLHLETLLQGIVAAPERALSELPLLPSAERHQLVVEWNQTVTAFPRDRCIHELFEAQAERAPEATAVTWGHQRMSYGELNSRANQLARFLKQFDIKPDVPIGLCVERSSEMVVGTLAILKAGGAYVPLDANYPKERLAFMLEDTRAPVVLTQQRLLEHVPRTSKVVCLDADWELIARKGRENTVNLANAQSLAYIMYTSGSTGQPKGVAVPHRAVNRLVLNNGYIRLDSSDRIAQVSNISFDAATFELWGALLNGAQLVGITRDVALSPKDFAAELREQGITAMFLTAALFNQLASEAPGAFETLRTVIAGGEALDPKWVRAVLRDRPPRRLLNGYGPTENTTFTCCHVLRDLGEGVLNAPIGRPISNTTVYVLDSHLNPVPIGVPGELYTGGDGLARGYWRRPELTAEKFISNPFDKTGSSHLYRTGDLARYLPDGNLEFLGRFDGQIKIRGFRVELGEIEAFLGRHPAIRDCVVTVTGTSSLTKRLVAYMVPASEQGPNASELRAFLMEKLPEYMIPSAFVSVSALPLTPNGKVDRKALPAPDQARPELDRQYVAPRDATEGQLVGIWEKILGVSPVGVQDRFFDLGGHSMLAVRVTAQIEKAFGKKLRLATLFQAPTIERLAAVLRGEVKESNVAVETSLVQIQGQGPRPPLFLVHGAGGGMFWGYINLSRCLGTEQPVYGFKSRGLDGREEFARIEDMAAQYISDMRTVQPHGPYYLGGYCFGGNVAYEMARQLTEQGEKVGLLAVLNCAPPNSRYTRIAWTPGWALKFVRNLLHWGNSFCHWNATQRREFFRWKWRLLKKRLARTRTTEAGGLSKVEPGDLVDLSSYTEEQKAIWETHIRALMSFRPQQYDGRLHLFRSPGHPLWCSFDEEYGWGELAKGGVKAVIVSGAHEKILEEPWVKTLAEKLTAALRQAQESPASPATQASALAAGRSAASHEKEAEHLAYWQRQLGDAPELLELPADRPRPAHRDHVNARYVLALPGSVARGIEKLAAGRECGTFGVFLAAFAAVLQRYTGSNDIVIGSADSQLSPHRPQNVRTVISAGLQPGGKQQEREPAVSTAFRVGTFENPVVLRCNLSRDPSFGELMTRVESTTQQAIAHCAVPFERIVAALRPQTSPSYAPLFQVLLRVQEEVPLEGSGGGLSFAACAIDQSTSKYDLSLHLARNPEGYSGWIGYSPALFDSSRISRLVEHLETLLKSAISDPDRPLSKLELLPDHEARKLLVEWTATQRDYPKHKTLVDLFRAQVQRTPDAEALVSGGERLTYAKLYSRAAELGARFRSMGVTTESLVGICVERSAEMIAAMLGTWFAGGAYVPLDPKYPKDRLSAILQDAKVKVLLTQKKLLGSLPQTDSAVLCLDNLEDPPGGFQTEVLPAGQATDLAYVIYTSGSTGKPKGVALEHRNAVALVCWAKEAFTAEELSGVLASTSICFDLSVFELFVPLSWGGKVILAQDALALAALPAAGEVRLINTVPSAIRELLRLRAVPNTVQVINLAGEPLSTELADQIYQETKVRKVFDLYGPTETTTYSTGTLRKPSQAATIGRPLANEEVYLLDSSLSLVPIGVPGELFIGGAGLARCYLNCPELTSQKFIAHPFKNGARLYRTGDLARWRAEGTLEYLGRIDHQVKIRGFRIELGEIETVLKSEPAVGAAVAVAREDRPGDKRLVAYVVPRPGAVVSVKDLRRKIREQLPDFMAPSGFVLLEALPMTPNGKIDRKALPAPEERSDARPNGGLSPRTALEEQLTAIWRDVLGLKQVGVQDNFFDLGGHSLLAVRIISAIRDAFKLELPLSTLFSAPTVTALAEVVASMPAPPGLAAFLPVSRIPRKGRLPVSYVQERLWFLDQLEPGGAAYNVPTALRLKGPLNVVALQRAVNEVISRHEALRSAFQFRDDGLAQVIAERITPDIPCIDLRNEPANDRELKSQELANREARRPFDLASGPLIRITLFRVDEADHLLLVVMHHIISDGWSLALFFQELATLYDAFTAGHAGPSMHSLPIQYVDFAHWQRQWMQGAVLERELLYWKQVLEGAPAEVELPLDHPRPDHPSGRAICQSVQLPTSSVQNLMDFARRESVTPFMIFLAALMMTLRRWTAQDDLVVGTVVAGRTRREFESIIGCFMNFLPLRARVREDESAGQFLASVRSTVLEAQNHQGCPFEKIVEAVNPQRRLDRNPLYNVALLLQSFPQNLFPTETLETSSMPVSLEAALLDLRFEVEQTPQGLALTCEYKTDLFEPSTVEALLSSWVKVLKTLVRSPETKLREFELDPSLNERAKIADPAPGTATIAIASSFTAEPVGAPLRFWLQRLELQANLEFAPYHQVFQQLLDPDSLLASNRHGLNVVLARLEDWQPAGGRSSSADEAAVEQAIERSAAEFARAVKAAAGRSSAPLLICFCPSSPAFAAGATRTEWLGRIQNRLEEDLLQIDGVFLLKSEELARWYPVYDYYDASAEQLGHVPYTPLFFTALASGLARKYHALNRSGFKVIALDCDNTLWSGVCGEEGPTGIQLDAPRRALQEFMRVQRENGMLLCLCSKNNEEDVRAVFSQRSELPLRLERFGACRLNWQPKSENLKSLAQELGLGLDSFIFLDDNPVECAEVQANCPEVLTLLLPDDSSLIPQFLNHCWVFDHLKLTAEDAKRSEFYQQNRMREKLRADAPTLEDFLAGLELEVQIEPVSPADWARVAQLTQRTNQFNFTTRRLNEKELGKSLESGEALVVRVKDRFGDYGLVGAVLFSVSENSLVVDNFLLSCRVLGRGVEQRMLVRLGEIAKERGASWLDLHFVPTAKNKPALDFLDHVGRAFKQPLNGGSIFRLPAELAAKTGLHPSSEHYASRTAETREATSSTTRPAHASSYRFSLCREIALEANDAATIHQSIQNAVSVRPRHQINYAAPQTDLERQLCLLWQDLLHVRPVGVQDDFFELGGHSLLAVRLFAEIEKIVGRKFPLVTLFQAPTIEQLARVLARTDDARSLLVPIQPRGAKPPLFLIHGAGGDVLWGYASLASHLPPDQPVYGIKSHGQGGLEEPLRLEEMARSYLEVVRVRQPQGPYYLGGYCFGGNVAYEMARQLQMQGQRVALVVLIDAAPANAGYESLTWWRTGFAWRFGRNLGYWLADFIDLEPKERRRFIGRKLRWVGRKLKRRFGGQSAQPLVDLEEVIDLRHFPEQELKLWQLHLEALLAHVERPYTGEVALLRTRGQPLFCSLEKDFCWGRLVKGGVAVRCIPGSHENIFMELNVRVLASELAKLLDQAHSPTPTSSPTRLYSAPTLTATRS